MYLTNEKVTVLGAAGAIGSNLVQSLLQTRTAHRISMYDPLEGPLTGAAEEIYHCAFPGAHVNYSIDEGEALENASYVITAGGAPRREGMTREDLRKDNSQIAKNLGQMIKRYCPSCKLAIVIFNPADITGLTTLVYSGLQGSAVATLAGLDSTRLQSALAQHFSVSQTQVTGCATYGGHGEQMAVFKGRIAIAGTPLTEILKGEIVEGKTLSTDQWTALQQQVREGGARIIKLRGRSSFQSPAHLSVAMLQGRLGINEFPWPCGTYVNEGEFRNIMMAMETRFGSSGIEYIIPQGDAEDMAALRESYRHLTALRDQTIADGILPPLDKWEEVNPNLV